jgi:hypothetical protein
MQAQQQTQATMDKAAALEAQLAEAQRVATATAKTAAIVVEETDRNIAKIEAVAAKNGFDLSSPYLVWGGVGAAVLVVGGVLFAMSRR